MTTRIIARFHPQAWADPHNPAAGRVDAEPNGPTDWDVTEELLLWSRDKALALRDNSFATENLRFHDNAPIWARQWPGPFWVEVAQSIRDYFAAVEA